jgi:hypothetical protein
VAGPSRDFEIAEIAGQLQHWSADVEGNGMEFRKDGEDRVRLIRSDVEHGIVQRRPEGPQPIEIPALRDEAKPREIVRLVVPVVAAS